MRQFVPVVLAFLAATALSALEVEQGSMKLVLDETSSRFLLELAQPDGEPIDLIYPEDPRTSGLDIREGNRIFRMGDGGEFRQVAEQTDEGTFYVWTSPTLRVSERFRFIRAAGSNSINGVQINIAITNLGEQSVPVAARLLLDTYLGERGNSHFSTPISTQITREAEIVPSARQSYIRSHSADASDGLQVMLSGEGITTPSQVAVANWKRLSDSGWEYVVNPDRNFNRLPYSINDSALLMTYEERILNQNERYEIVVQMGGFAPNGYLPPESSQPITASQRNNLLDQINDLIAKIDALIADPSATAEDVAELQRQLEAISDQVSGQ